MTIYRRQDGRWAGSLDLGRDGNGKRRRLTFYGTRQRDVRKMLTTAKHDQQRGLLADPSRETLRAFLARWLRVSVKPSVKPSTHASYEEKVRLYIVPELGSIPLQKLSPPTVQALYTKLLERGLSPRSVQYVHAILHRALAQALKWGLVARNLTEAVDRPQVRPKPMRALSAAEAARLLKAAQDDRLHALYVVALTGGLRQGELFGLRWSDVDLDRGRIHVVQQLARGEGGVPTLTDLKSRSSRRVVKIPALAVEALRTHRLRQLEERLALGEAWQNPELVFATTIGTPLAPSNLTRQSFRPLLKRAKLPQIRFHDLRHSCATLLLEAGVHPKIVSERLGHSAVSLTLDTYSHVLPSMQRAAAEKIDALLAAVG
jgi:integrase